MSWEKQKKLFDEWGLKIGKLEYFNEAIKDIKDMRNKTIYFLNEKLKEKFH